MDARRAADRLGIPFYVWDFSERFRDDVIEDFVAEYSAGRTPEPLHALQRADQVRRRAREGARPRLRRRVHRATTRSCATDASGALELHRASDNAKDQSYVLGVLTAEQLAHTHLPARRDAVEGARARRGRGPRAHRRAQARQPRHLLHPRRRHPRLARRAGRRRDGRRSSTAPARSSAPTRARTPSRSASAAASRSACRRPTASRGSCSRCGPSRTRWSSARRRRSRPPRSRGSASPGRDAPPDGIRLRVPRADPRPRRPGAGAREHRRRHRSRCVPRHPLDGVAPGQTAVLYVGTRVLGQFTIDRTVSAVPAPV